MGTNPTAKRANSADDLSEKQLERALPASLCAHQPQGPEDLLALSGQPQPEEPCYLGYFIKVCAWALSRLAGSETLEAAL